MDGDGDDDHDDGTGDGNGDDNYDDGDDDDDTRPIFLEIDNMKVQINTSLTFLPLLSELAPSAVAAPVAALLTELPLTLALQARYYCLEICPRNCWCFRRIWLLAFALPKHREIALAFALPKHREVALDLDLATQRNVVLALDLPNHREIALPPYPSAAFLSLSSDPRFPG